MDKQKAIQISFLQMRRFNSGYLCEIFRNEDKKDKNSLP